MRNWIDGARYDLQTAADMFKSRRYIYVVFMSHQAVEKSIKAAVQKKTGRMPPRIHDLISLTKRSGCRPGEDLRNVFVTAEMVAATQRASVSDS